MKEKLNTYIAILLITIAGSGAALIIVRVATNDVIAATMAGNEVLHASLRQSIISNRQ